MFGERVCGSAQGYIQITARIMFNWCDRKFKTASNAVTVNSHARQWLLLLLCYCCGVLLLHRRRLLLRRVRLLIHIGSRQWYTGTVYSASECVVCVVEWTHSERGLNARIWVCSAIAACCWLFVAGWQTGWMPMRGNVYLLEIRLILKPMLCAFHTCGSMSCESFYP